MTKLICAIIITLITFLSIRSVAQEKYGKTLNIALGIGGYSGYYKYAGRAVPILHLNYEFDVDQYFTLAPFISIYRFEDNYYWGNNNTPYRTYQYRETVIPIGVKGTYYFDKLLEVNNDWDFYMAASIGTSIVSSQWEAGYPGDRNPYHNRSIFLDLHLGGEYHLKNNLGITLDLSSGVSTLGLAIHSIH